MLFSMRFGISLLGGHNRHSMILASGLNAIKHHDTKSPIKRALINYYHCTRPTYGQKHESPSTEQYREKFSKARLDILDKVKAAQIEYKSVSLATVITLSRAAMAPALGYFIFSGMYPEAIACMTYVATSDVADKIVAARTKQASPTNAILDSISDKLVITTSVIAMYNMSILPIWLVKGLVFKDITAVLIGAMVRYYGFSEPPSRKKFFDFNHYPTLGLKPLIIERLSTGTLYALVTVHLAMSETLRNEYFWPVTIFQHTALILTCVVIGLRVVHLTQHRFLTRISKCTF